MRADTCRNSTSAGVAIVGDADGIRAFCLDRAVAASAAKRKNNRWQSLEINTGW